MQAVRIHRFGGPEVMAIEEIDRPTPAADEVVIKVFAASVNPVDAKARPADAMPPSPSLVQTARRTPAAGGLPALRTLQPPTIPLLPDTAIVAANRRGVQRFAQASIPSSERLRASLSDRQSSLNPSPHRPNRPPRSLGW